MKLKQKRDSECEIKWTKYNLLLQHLPATWKLPLGKQLGLNDNQSLTNVCLQDLDFYKWKETQKNFSKTINRYLVSHSPETISVDHLGSFQTVVLYSFPWDSRVKLRISLSILIEISRIILCWEYSSVVYTPAWQV